MMHENDYDKPRELAETQMKTPAGIARLILSELNETYFRETSYLQQIRNYGKAPFINVLKGAEEMKATACIEENGLTTLFFFNTKHPYTNGPQERATAYKFEISDPTPSGKYTVVLHRGEGSFFKDVSPDAIVERFGIPIRSRNVTPPKGFTKSKKFFFMPTAAAV